MDGQTQIARLFGREHELREIGAALSGISERGSALLIVGEPGVGKSALLAAAIERIEQIARRSGDPTLAASVLYAHALLADEGEAGDRRWRRGSAGASSPRSGSRVRPAPPSTAARRTRR